MNLIMLFYVGTSTLLDPKKDSHNYKNINNPKARLATMELMDEVDLLDLYRTLHTDTIRYTWRRKQGNSGCLSDNHKVESLKLS